VATATVAQELLRKFFKVLGTVFSVVVLLLWLVVAGGTTAKAYTGELFFAPCLQGWRQRLDEKGRRKNVALV
jgi:hypothetical protein